MLLLKCWGRCLNKMIPFYNTLRISVCLPATELTFQALCISDTRKKRWWESDLSSWWGVWPVTQHLWALRGNLIYSAKSPGALHSLAISIISFFFKLPSNKMLVIYKRSSLNFILLLKQSHIMNVWNFYVAVCKNKQPFWYIQGWFEETSKRER